MALIWLAPDRSVLSVAFVSHRKWRFVGNTAQLARVAELLMYSTGSCAAPTTSSIVWPTTSTPPDARPPAAPGRGSLRCHARLPIGTLTQPRRSHASAKTTLPRNLAGTRQLIRAITIPAIGASLLCHLERCGARASPLPLHSDLDAPAARQYGRIEYGGFPVKDRIMSTTAIICLETTILEL